MPQEMLPPMPQAPPMGPPGGLQSLVENPDGSATVQDPTVQGPPQADFGVNLVKILPERTLERIAADLLDWIEIDRNARTKRDEQYAEGIRRTGLGNDTPGGAEFDGASRVVHPVLAEACVDYSSAAIKELFPPDGPVKTHFLSNSDANTSVIELAEAKRDFYNWQLTRQIEEYRPNLEVLLTQEPLGGSQYLKFWWDDTLGRICCEFVPVDNVLLPYDACSFYSAGRMTLMVDLDRIDYESRVKSGMYVDADLGEPSSLPEPTKSSEATAKVEGKEDPSYNEDGVRRILESYIYYDVEDEGPAPYIISIDEYSRKVVGLYRNWAETDQRRKKLDWVAEFQFIPWRGAYGVGLAHLIGGLTASATGALRALLDSAHIQNFAGGLKLKGTRTVAGTTSVAPTEISEIEAPAGVDDIRKVMMPFPFPGPSPTLFQLLGFVVEAAKGVVQVANEKLSDAAAGNQMPVGTAMALIEQGSKVYSAIHARQHAAQCKVLEILDRLNAQYYDPQVQVEHFGRVIVPVEAFAKTNNIAPVSDPNIFSESHRFAQLQGVFQLFQTLPPPAVGWNMLAIAQRALRLMHVDNPNELLPPPPQPVSADPDTEIAAAMSGQQLAAQQQMDHMQHVQVELQFLLDPVFGAANPAIMNPGFSVIMGDVMAHWQMLRTQMKQQATQMAMQQFQAMVTQSVIAAGVPPQAVQLVSAQQMQNPAAQQMVQQQANVVFQQMIQNVAPIAQMLQQADQLVKSKMPPPQTDPMAQVQLQLGQAEIQRKSQMDQATLQLKQQELSVEAQTEARRVQMNEMREQFDMFMQKQQQMLDAQAASIAEQNKIAMNDADNRQHAMTELIKNRDDNQTNMLIEQMRQEGLESREQMKLALHEQQAKLDALIGSIVDVQKAQINAKTQEKIAQSKPVPKAPSKKEE